MSNLAWDAQLKTGLFDCGNILCEYNKLEDSQVELEKAIEKVLQLGLIPIVLGDGHDIAFGHFNGIYKYLNKKETSVQIGIINFDAHFDLRPYAPGKSNSGTMFRQIADQCKNTGTTFNYYCLGIQTYANTKNLFKTAAELETKYELAKNIGLSTLNEVKSKLNQFIEKQKHIYLTICADVFSSACAPGVSAPQPFGLQPDIGLELIKHVASSGKIISFDLAEIAPRFDEDKRTAKLGAVLIYAIVNTISSLKIKSK
jgi:formiminoglutamase